MRPKSGRSAVGPGHQAAPPAPAPAPARLPALPAPAGPTLAAEALPLAAALGEEAVEGPVDVAGEDAGQGQPQADGLHRPHGHRRQQQQAERGPTRLHARTRAARACPRRPRPRQTRLPLPPRGRRHLGAGPGSSRSPRAPFLLGAEPLPLPRGGAGSRWGPPFFLIHDIFFLRFRLT